MVWPSPSMKISLEIPITLPVPEYVKSFFNVRFWFSGLFWISASRSEKVPDGSCRISALLLAISMMFWSLATARVILLTSSFADAIDRTENNTTNKQKITIICLALI